jgi:two-component system sensor histidine kinase TctE
LLIQLLNLAKAEGGVAAESDTSPVDLRELVQEVAEEHLPHATRAGIGLHYEAAPIPCPARLDPITLREILANLIDNAIRYNTPGGHVVVRLLVADGARIIEVEDDGPGIPSAEHEKVFTRFYRLKRDQDRVGSGLGLAIVRSLVALMDASLQLTSPGGDGGRGLRVRLVLPE